MHRSSGDGEPEAPAFDSDDFVPYRPRASRRREETPRLLTATAEGPVNAEGVSVRCLQCRSVQKVMLDASGFTCRECKAQWHWAICDATGHLALAREEQESWKCPECGGFTRSWWKAADFWRDIERVVERRHAEEAEAERRRRRARLRARRAAIFASVAIVTFLIVSAVIVRTAQKNDPAAAKNVACRHFDRLQASETNGALNRQQLLLELRQVVDESQKAPTEMRQAATLLYAAAAHGTASQAYLAAVSRTADACA